MNSPTDRLDLNRVTRQANLLFAFVLASCVFAARPSPAQTVVYTVNYPLAYFAERIGAAAVRVEFPAPGDIDPAFWTPTPEIIAAYQKADLILLNGAGYAGWVSQASLPRRNLVDTSRSFRESYLAGEQTPAHQHGPKGEHTHGQILFTTWLDPKQAIAQARAIEGAFARHRPNAAETFTRNADSLIADLERLDCALADSLRGLSGEPLLASHPIYGYLARRYALDLQSVTWEPEVLPSSGDWRQLDALRADHQAEWMLWEATPLEATRDQLRDRRIEVIVFQLSGNRPAKGDYLSVMRGNIETLRRVTRQTGKWPTDCASIR